MDGTETFGHMLHRLRTRARLSLRAVGDLAHVSHTYVYEVEKGHKVPSDKVAAALDGAVNADGALIAALKQEKETREHKADIHAADGLHVAWTYKGLLHLLEEWPNMLSRRTFITLTGAALTGPAWEWMDAPIPALARMADGTDSISEGLLAVIDNVVASAQQLDDQHGSAGAVFVADQVTAVDRLLRHASYTDAAGKRLSTSLAQLAQTSGWMAHDRLRDGEAQRWYLIGLHAAHCADDHALAASILALMSNQASTLNRQEDAIQLAAAAQEAARPAPAKVRALISARSGLAYAGAGDLAGFHRMRDQAMCMLDVAESSHRKLSNRLRHQATCVVCGEVSVWGVVSGWLIHTLVGRGGG
ncbi:helix-turn-helix domain-containing protein [Nonomuraea polychroma]|uniref:helix-turn-helix domain-containing protein n=1 Tax=Nonomuraea polychroma TaxID=46176 RepID=UPI003D8F486D